MASSFDGEKEKGWVGRWDKLMLGSYRDCVKDTVAGNSQLSFPKENYKKSEKIAANRNGQQIQMILKLRVLKRSDVKFWRPNLFVVANFATFCSILSHLQQM